MDVFDYARSTIRFEIAGVNQARIAVEASCRLQDPDDPDMTPLDLYLVASCKAEQTYGPGQLFREPNYDFCILYTDADYCIRRIGAVATGDELEGGSLEGRFDHVQFAFTIVEAEPLPDAEAVIEAALDNRIIVARTAIHDPNSGVVATVEYPVKTLNVNPDGGLFQTDTGPVPVPAEGGWNGELTRFDVAYAAFNRWDQVEFIRQRPLPLTDSVTVQHYHEVDAMPAENSLWAIVD